MTYFTKTLRLKFLVLFLWLFQSFLFSLRHLVIPRDNCKMKTHKIQKIPPWSSFFFLYLMYCMWYWHTHTRSLMHTLTHTYTHTLSFICCSCMLRLFLPLEFLLFANQHSIPDIEIITEIASETVNTKWQELISNVFFCELKSGNIVWSITKKTRYLPLYVHL